MISDFAGSAYSPAPDAGLESGGDIAGLVVRHCPCDHAATIARLAAGVAARNMVTVAHVDHAAAAMRLGFKMRPTDLFIFGNAGVGTSMMKAAPTLAIDLPLKMLVWQADSGVTMLAYNAPAWVAERHGVDAVAGETVRVMSDGLEAIADFIVGPGKGPVK